MSIKICTNNNIELDNHRIELADADGRKYGLYVTQRREGTVVYSASFAGGIGYKEHKMPHARYSLTHEAPLSGAAGLRQFEADIRDLIMTAQP